MKYTNIIKKEIKVMLVVVVILLLVVLGVSYALFMQVTDNTNNQVVTTGSLQIEYASTNGYIENDTYKELLPMSNDQGLLQSGYEFSVKNTGSLPVAYNVYLYVNYDEYNKDIEAGTITGDIFEDLSLIHYNLQTNDDGNTDINILSVQTKKEEDGITKYVLHSDEVSTQTNITNTHKLRIWLDEDIDVTEIGKYIYLKLEVTSYVKGQEPKLCKRATELHEEICNQTDTTKYCSGTGYAQGSTITYGNLGIGDTIATGDAFDCDVNGDGIYNSTNERFYYVSDYYDTNTKEFNEDYATLVYYNSTKDGISDNSENSVSSYYSLANENWHGPLTSIKNLPSTSQWNNINLLMTNRIITNEKSENNTTNGDIENPFNYSGYSARFLTAQEINKGCDITIGSFNEGELDKCLFLLENTNFGNEGIIYGYWLENPYSSDTGAWIVIADYKRVVLSYRDTTYEEHFNIRPAIEVAKSDMSL